MSSLGLGLGLPWVQKTAASGGGGGSQTFTAGGSHPFVVPAGITSLNIEGIGAGGMGSSFTVGNTAGGGGAWAKSTGIAVVPSETLHVILYTAEGGDEGGQCEFYRGGTLLFRAASGDSFDSGRFGGQAASCVQNAGAFNGGDGPVFPGAGGGGSAGSEAVGANGVGTVGGEGGAGIAPFIGAAGGNANNVGNNYGGGGGRGNVGASDPNANYQGGGPILRLTW